VLAAIEHAGDLRRPAGQDSATVAAELATKLVEEHLGKPAALAKAIDSAADDIVREQARRQLTAKIATEADAAAGRFVVEHSDSVLAAFGKALDAPIAVLAEHAGRVPPFDSSDRTAEIAYARVACTQSAAVLQRALSVVVQVAPMSPKGLGWAPITLALLHVVDVPAKLSLDDADHLVHPLHGKRRWSDVGGIRMSSLPWWSAVAAVPGTEFSWASHGETLARRDKLIAALSQPSSGLADAQQRLVRA